MGVKGNRARKQNNEPSLIRNIDDVIRKAKEKGFIKEFTDLNSNYRVNIESIINNEPNLCLVKDSEMESTVSGSLVKDKDSDKWIIRINTKHNPKRQRFTMAHEYAHYILHKDDRGTFVDEEIYFRKDNPSSIEYSADMFASELLMPEQLFLDIIRRGNITSKLKLAEIFDVSVQAIDIRVNKLKEKGV